MSCKPSHFIMGRGAGIMPRIDRQSHHAKPQGSCLVPELSPYNVSLKAGNLDGNRPGR